MSQRFTLSFRVMTQRLFVAVALVIAALVVAPCYALGREYSIDEVAIEATLSNDGSLTVQEEREFDFDGSFHGVYWKIPTGSFKGRTIDVSVLSVGEVKDGEFVEFNQSTSGDEHTYELEQYDSYVQVKIYSSHDDERARFGITYECDNLAARYDDTAELYWKFVSSGWEVESENVSCVIHLPVPNGVEVVPGENARAWGHGPYDARVDFKDGDVCYALPGVGSAEYAEARIAFSPEWLSGVQSQGGMRLDEILQEEQGYADEANARRNSARMLIGGIGIAGTAIPLVSLIGAAAVFFRYKRNHKPHFDDKYFRDVPTDDHPAVLGCLYHGGEVKEECLTAALMRLTDQKEAKLEPVKLHDTGLLGREKVKEDYCLTPIRFPQQSEAQTSSERIDYATMRYLFQRLAPLTARIDGNHDCLYFGSLEQAANKYPESYESYRTSWNDAVKAECDNRSFFVDETESHAGLLFFGGFLNILLGIGVGGALVFLDAPVLMAFLAIALFTVSAIVLIGLGASLEDYSREAIEVKAKLEALKRWLEDFTRLEEAVPQDVMLWNRLLVMAVVLDVSDKVIKQLRTAAPQVLEDQRMAPVYGWYYMGGPSVPTYSFTSAVSTAHSVSAGQLASSSNSSGSGLGGGFSGGGGGGFGNSGGGGAF